LRHPGSRIRGVKKHRIPDPTYFCIKAINKFCLLIPDPDPTIAPSRIPDPGGKKAPDPDQQHCSWPNGLLTRIADPDPQEKEKICT
jgi:hypothetical protein